MLWIAFKLVSLQCTNNEYADEIEQISVVNCFQISIFAVHEQQGFDKGSIAAGCELLSN